MWKLRHICIHCLMQYVHQVAQSVFASYHCFFVSFNSMTNKISFLSAHSFRLIFPSSVSVVLRLFSLQTVHMFLLLKSISDQFCLFSSCFHDKIRLLFWQTAAVFWCSRGESSSAEDHEMDVWDSNSDLQVVEDFQDNATVCGFANGCRLSVYLDDCGCRPSI